MPIRSPKTPAARRSPHQARAKQLVEAVCEAGRQLLSQFGPEALTTTRIAENHFMMTTTTAKAGPVMQHLEYHAQIVWPELDVNVISVTEEWAGMALAGPDSRRLLEAILQRTATCCP